MKLKPYPKYKDSEIDWIGEIPEAWGMRKIKQFSRIVTGSTPDSGNDAYWDGNINWITPADLSQRKKYSPDSKRKITKEGYDSCGTIYVYGGSIILATRAPIGYATIVKEKLCFNQGCKAFKIDMQKIVPDYIYYFLNAHEDVLISLGNVTTFGELSTYNLASFLISLPPKKEQQKISSFLDKKNLEINNTIQKDKQLIELLKEKKIALINHVVTKGLDPNAKIKDSGIQWIGDIPEGWEVRRIDKLSSVRRGASPRPIEDPIYFDDQGEYSWVRIADVTASDRYLLETTEKLSVLGKSLSVPLLPGRLFISVAGTVGKPIITKIKCCIHDGFVYFQNLKILNEYLYYIFIGGQAYLGLGKWGTQLNLNTETIGLISIPLPPKSEQQRIVQYLDKQTSKVEKTIQKIERKIKLLEEYKKSLIHYVITGKIDVRSVTA